jgi:hypothetical protein
MFVSAEWTRACEMAKIVLRRTGTEAHNALGAVEKRNDTLRRVYDKVSHDYPQIVDTLRLALSVQAANNTAGPDGLVPSFLVFSVSPRILKAPTKDFPKKQERFMAIKLAREEYSRFVARQRIQQGLRKLPPAAAYYAITPGDLVYVYRERPRKWTGLYPVADVSKKCVMLRLGELTGPRSFNLSQTKPARLPKPPPVADSITHSREEPYAFITEVLSPEDERADLFDDAKRAEILGLIQRGTFKNVRCPGRSRTKSEYYTIKNKGTKNELIKGTVCCWRSPRSRQKWHRSLNHDPQANLHPHSASPCQRSGF